MDENIVFINERAQALAKSLDETPKPTATKDEDEARLRDIARRLVRARTDYCRALQDLDNTWAVSAAAVNDVIDFDYAGREYLSDDEAYRVASALAAEVRRALDVG